MARIEANVVRARRLGWSSGGAAFSATAILALFQVQGWTMPEWLAIIVFAALVAGGFLFTGFLVLEARSVVASVEWPRIGFQSPIYVRNKSTPDTRLLAHAKRHIDKPIEMLPMLDRRVLSWDFDSRRPQLTISVTIFNGTQFKIRIGAATGHPIYAGGELADAVESAKQEAEILSGKQADIRFTVYIPNDLKDEVFAEISNQRLIRNLSLRKVTVPVKVRDDWLAAYSTEESLLSMGDERLHVGPH
jgi:hypothetical protein